MSYAATPVRLWMRSENRPEESRAPITPDDAGRLVRHGAELTVEESPHRVFPVTAYVAAGVSAAPAGSWVDAPGDCYIIGLKELPERPAGLRHRHIYFGHAYKGQRGSRALLSRFAAGGGMLLDLEYLTSADGRRLAAFGYWAGYAGAALAAAHHGGALAAPLRPGTQRDMDETLRQCRTGRGPRALVIGALGRSGRGACDALAAAGIKPTRWDLAETRVLDREALLSHAILVNTVLSIRPALPFLTKDDFADPRRRLTVAADVSCDVGSPCNLLPVYDTPTTWQDPVRRLTAGPPPLELIAIDNLPALLPVEASTDFSAQLLPHLTELSSVTPPWQRCIAAFTQACRAAGAGSEASHA
jgi:saccharopine dehydrogenase (NAD+, L-lysine forming)